MYKNIFPAHVLCSLSQAQSDGRTNNLNRKPHRKVKKTEIKILANSMQNLFLYFTSVPRMASKANGIILKFIIGKVNSCVFDIVV